MGGARHPKPYKDGKRQVTIPWKRRVLAKLKDNEKRGHKPAKIEHLRDLIGAPKGGLNTLFKLDKDPPQLTSAYVDEILEVLEIAPPLVEEDADDEQFVRDVELLRRLTDEARRDLMLIARQMPRKSR
jgi:hypothetical protein